MVKLRLSLVALAGGLLLMTPAVTASTPRNSIAVVEIELAVTPMQTKYGELGGYDPRVLTVHVGDGVRWQNLDPEPHTATSRGFPTDGRVTTGSTISQEPWSSGDVAPHGKSRLFVAARPGVFYYNCGYHFKLGQRGVIVVLP